MIDSLSWGSFPQTGSFSLLEAQNFRKLVDTFVELRGQGVMLSSQDMEVLQVWQSQGLACSELLQFFQILKEECDSLEKPFPQKLASVNHYLKKWQAHGNRLQQKSRYL